ncbi:MAG: energy transducer TonB [Sphingomonadales bacterium]|nr:energy transducer TonB [Sphingomonadales bacterium]MDE2170109.1 energy transducer TonB [Sphingomonadales bacterium]
MLTDQSALAFPDEPDFATAPTSPVRPPARGQAPRLALVETHYAFAPSYGQASLRQRGPAALVAFGAVALLFSALVWMNVHPHHRHQPRIVALDMKLDQAPPPKEQPKPQDTKADLPTTPVAAPQPAMASPAPIAPVALSPAPAAPAPPMVEAPPAPPAAPPAPPKASGPAEGGDISTRMLSFVAPTYPLESRRMREEGTVTLSLLLSLDGRVSEISVSGSSGFARLDKAALEAVRKWRWAPVMRNGEAVMVRGTVKIPFLIKH